MVKIAGSFLKIQDDFDRIKTLDRVCDMIHFDVMDGKFTEKKTLPIEKMKETVLSLDKPFDVHLMVRNLKKYIDEVAILNPSYITFHLEASIDALDIINYIHDKGIKVGIAINPATDIDKLYPYLDLVDLVLIMSVKAGAGGQTFIDITDRLNIVFKYREDNNLSYVIEFDGGINDTTIRYVRDADIVVAGSFITNSDNYQSQVYKLKRALRNGFTLAELLGVIVILSILGLIAFTAIDSNLRESRYDTCMVQRTNLIEGAKTLVIDYPDLLPAASGQTVIPVQVLDGGGTVNGQTIKGGYIEKDLVNPMTDKPYIESDVSVIITSNNGSDFDYTVNFANPDEDCHE